MIDAVCRKPPITSNTSGRRSAGTPQRTTMPRGGSSVPRDESMPITIDAASAPEMKKMATNEVTAIHGYGSLVVDRLDKAADPISSECSAVPLMIVNQRKVTPLAMSRTPMTNSSQMPI